MPPPLPPLPMHLPQLEPRPQAPAVMVLVTPVLALVLTLLTGLLLFSAMGYAPLAVLFEFFIAPLTDLYGIAELVVKATPLVLCAIGLAIGFRANVWNIGAEGQLTIGALAGGGLAVWFPLATNPLMLPLMLLLGVIGGMAWAAVPALLKTRYGANEILTSLMLTYVAVLLLSALVHGPWRDPGGYNFPESVLFPPAAMLPLLVDGTRLHLGALFAVAAVIAAWFVLARAVFGFEVKVIGLSPAAADYAGMSAARITWFVLLISGGLAGLAGIVEVTGPIGQIQPTISPGYGFTAIIVAFLGRLHPLGILIAGHILALSYLGGETVQITLGLPQGIAGVFQGMLLFFLLACDVLLRYRVRWRRSAVAAS